ncbi:MAG: acetyl-CoA carboxylase biotin carboxylase subunit [Rickettsiales bacterium]|nr:acetyl-CoA carboxylase biotin carboxylase subunit [Rickettsiales bacterium]OUV83279.1 MAG: acetyl-CoA carboxylase biotin carboxylase subunit [Rickettsiales bacterium TMED131]
MFKKVLIANRGEIAVRIIRSCKELGIKTVAIYSLADTESMHVRMADESICIGGTKSSESYLNIPSIVTAAELTGAEAIHPGYGFLSENFKFARILEEHNITFIGPKSEHIKIMGDKVSARNIISKTGIPLVPGSDGPLTSIKNLKKVSKEIGYPVIIKASAGGGGKGMQVVENENEIENAYNLTKSEAEVNFGNDEIYVEKFLKNPKHIEFQIFADNYQNVIHLGERDCSIQRRHQKLIEEAPAFEIDQKEKMKLLSIIISAMKEIKYRGAGTIEMLYEDGKFYFIEMNTRIQVEHPVTEMITGVDIVSEQIKAASGKKLSLRQDDIKFRGHAIECRINAENPESFIPSPGKINMYNAPGGLGVRVDSCIYNGYKVVPYYDSLIGKLIVHAENREDAISRMKRSLDELVVDGIDTTKDLHKKIISSKAFEKYDFSINWLENYLKS